MRKRLSQHPLLTVSGQRRLVRAPGFTTLWVCTLLFSLLHGFLPSHAQPAEYKQTAIHTLSTVDADRQVHPFIDIIKPKPSPGTAGHPAVLKDTTDGSRSRSFIQALSGGIVELDIRPRGEFVRATGLQPGRAVTNRVRLGYGTGSFAGVSAHMDFVHIHPFTPSRYNAAGLNDQPDRAVVADPEMVLLNQLYGQYIREDSKTLLRTGRQRIILDDARFVGNVGWRQNEQTYDAVTLSSSLGIEGLEAHYSMVWQVNRVFGPDHPAGTFDSGSHLFNLSYESLPFGNLTGFIYLLDFDNAQTLSSNTFGSRLNGSISIRGDDLSLSYLLSYALQQEAGNNPVDYTAGYYRADLHLQKEAWGRLGAGYEVLGSDGGESAFQTPLATLHAFQGWADMLLSVPAGGVEDFNLSADVSLPRDIGLSGRHHWFHENEGTRRIGRELNVSLGKQFHEHWSLLLKFADFRGDSAIANTRKFWVQMAYQF